MKTYDDAVMFLENFLSYQVQNSKASIIKNPDVYAILMAMASTVLALKHPTMDHNSSEFADLIDPYVMSLIRTKPVAKDAMS